MVSSSAQGYRTVEKAGLTFYHRGYKCAQREIERTECQGKESERDQDRDRRRGREIRERERKKIGKWSNWLLLPVVACFTRIFILDSFSRSSIIINSGVVVLVRDLLL